ncbi:MAG: putative deoxynucleotide monophosphate kinase [Prokaryotic dsDNA virus sp.]|nr:MAG: putative deoxynucleotide monophosphate kinase [Prokaryotic dsDNA virus sp.]|tara:strand:- start:4261 stop:4932 length:672 start_codon:yes stop_codon:yes gene_type:complete
MLLGFSGFAGSGKNTVADIVSQELGNCVQVAFAAPLRELLGMCLGLTEEEVQSTYKEEVKVMEVMEAFTYCSADFYHGWLDFCGKYSLEMSLNEKCMKAQALEWMWSDLGEPITVRKLLQVLGTDFVRDLVDPNMWVYLTMNKVHDLLTRGKNVLITDVRFPNEAQTITYLGGQVIQIDRPSLVTKDQHKSEEPLPKELIDFVIVNDKGLKELKGKVLDILGV